MGEVQHGLQTITLYTNRVLTVVADVGASGRTYRTGVSGEVVSYPVTSVSSGETVTVGPFNEPTYHVVAADVGRLTYSADMAEFATVTDVVAVVGTVGDVCEIIGAGAPVDYTDGTPPATGEGVAGIGSRYTDTTAGKLYINGGTKAQPLWKLVTSAA